jgi:phage gp29-like protein
LEPSPRGRRPRRPEGLRAGRREPGARRKYRDRVSRLGVETTLVLPRKKKDEGYDFDVTAADINASHGFQARIDHSHMNIAIASLGQNLTTKIEGGSYAAADVHKRVKNDLLKSDVASLSTDCRDADHQAVGPPEQGRLAGRARAVEPVGRDSARGHAAEGADALTLSQALPGLQAVGVDIEPVLEEFDLELLPEDERPKPAPAPTGTPKPTDQAPAPAQKPASLTL